MKIDAGLLPNQNIDRSHAVCIVVDVLRASSSIVTLLERGAPRVVPAGSIDEARERFQRFPDHILCGEKGGLPPPGFHYGNSPAEFSRLDTGGRSAILATSNGTRLLSALHEAPVILVGCLLNRSAVAKAALAMAAAQGLNIAVLSSAHRGSVFVLEDALGAGAIIDAALTLDPALQPTDAARFARDAFVTASHDIGEAIASAYHAKELTDAGLGADVTYSARLDVSSVAPLLERGEDGVLSLRRG